MWRLIVALDLTLAACAPVSSVTRRAGGEGSYDLTCATSLAHCLEQVDELCHGSRYEVVHATDDRSYRGPSGSFEKETRSSTASIRCLPRGRSIFEPSEQQHKAIDAGSTSDLSSSDVGGD